MNQVELDRKMTKQAEIKQAEPSKNESIIDFIDLSSQQKRIRPQVEKAFSKILDHGHYILGPEVFELEKQLSGFCGAKYSLSCANGTDALALGLMAKKTNSKHAIFVPSFTFIATAEVVVWMNATPIYIDVDRDTYNMCPESLKRGIETAKKLALEPHGIIPVDLFGQPADYDSILEIAKEHGLWVMCDAAQSFGAVYKGKSVGNIGDMTSTSFYPAKPLGCYGDGGAVFTNDEELNNIFQSLRVHGQGTDKYDNVLIGMNGRLDTIQAAILLEKLKIFRDEIAARQKVAEYYSQNLADVVHVPKLLPNTTSVWAQYTMRLQKGTDRKQLMAHLKAMGIPTVIYYPKSIHQQKAYAMYPRASGDLPVSDALVNEVLSLPMHGYLTAEQQAYVVHGVRSFFKR